MFFPKRTMLLLILCSAATVASAQQKNPVFRNHAANINVPESVLSRALTSGKGQKAKIDFASDFSVSGEVMSNNQVFDNLQTMILKSPEYNNAVVQISKQVLADKTVVYVGRIFSEGSADGYHIKRNATGAYSLEKFEAAVIKQVCEL